MIERRERDTEVEVDGWRGEEGGGWAKEEERERGGVRQDAWKDEREREM